MLQLRDETHLILDSEVRVYRREYSKRWHKDAKSQEHYAVSSKSVIRHPPPSLPAHICAC